MSSLHDETTRTQKKAIKEHLLVFGEIDKPTAIEICDCDRLGARIYDLRNDPDDPLPITTRRVTKKNRFGHPTTYAVYELRREA